MTETLVNIAPIGFIQSCFRQKFGIPRQPGLVPAAQATLILLPDYSQPEAVRGLEAYSHLWIIFFFHGIPAGQWHPTVRPPRLGGHIRRGVFATRSPFRPNPMGLSVVRLEGILSEQGRTVLQLSGVDLLDGTPVLDIKPYLPDIDACPDATGSLIGTAPIATPLSVVFSDEAEAFCADRPTLRTLITQVLQQDPRPAYQQEPRRYGMCLEDCNISWEVQEHVARVIVVEKLTRPVV